MRSCSRGCTARSSTGVLGMLVIFTHFFPRLIEMNRPPPQPTKSRSGLRLSSETMWIGSFGKSPAMDRQVAPKSSVV